MEEWIPIANENLDWVTLIYVVNFILIVYIKWRYELQFFSFLRLIDTTTYMNNYGEKYEVLNGFILLSMLFSSLTLSMFCVFFLHHYFAITLSFLLFIYLIVGVLLTVLLRSLFILLLSNLLDVKRFFQSFQFRNCTYIFRLSIFLYTGLVFYHYGWNQSFFVFKLLFYGGTLIYLTSQVMVIGQLFSTINRGSLYFILYLCTLKMSPWILLFHGIKRLYV